MIIQEGDKDIKKIDNNLKLVQIDLDYVNNIKKIDDEKERIYNEKMKGLESEYKQLDEEIAELKELKAVKNKTLNDLKKRNEDSRRNKKKLLDQKKWGINEKASDKSDLDALEEYNDIFNKNNKKNNQANSSQTVKKKREKETKCQCLIQ